MKSPTIFPLQAAGIFPWYPNGVSLEIPWSTPRNPDENSYPY